MKEMIGTREADHRVAASSVEALSSVSGQVARPIWSRKLSYNRRGGLGEAKGRLRFMAIRLDQLIRASEVTDQAELARLENASRARLPQIFNLLFLAIDI